METSGRNLDIMSFVWNILAVFRVGVRLRKGLMRNEHARNTVPFISKMCVLNILGNRACIEH